MLESVNKTGIACHVTCVTYMTHPSTILTHITGDIMLKSRVDTIGRFYTNFTQICTRHAVFNKSIKQEIKELQAIDSLYKQIYSRI